VFGYTGEPRTYQELYRDDGNATYCSYYWKEGTSICDDVLAIPVNGNTTYQTVGIETPNFLTLCEVEVFGGNRNYVFIHVYTHIFINKIQMLIKIYRKIKNCNGPNNWH